MSTMGVGIYNWTGTDITTEDGKEYISHDLTESLTKEYSDRNIQDSLIIYIHHTAGSKKQSLESIASYHVNQRNWPGIAYHIAIDQNGNVNILNDIEKKTYHNSADNTRGIGIVAVGNYEQYEPSEKMISSIKALTDAMCLTLKIKAIKGHSDSKATACPGKYLYKRLEQDGVFFKNKK